MFKRLFRQTKIKKSLRFFLMAVFIFSWIFSGWPSVWQNPLLLPEIKEAQAASSFKVGSFAKRSGTGSQAVSDVGFQPEAIIFYWTKNTTDNATITAGGGSTGIGFATSSVSEYSVTQWSDDALTSNTGRGSSATQSIVITTTAGAVAGAANITSLDSGGFTLNWDTSDTNGYIIRYIAFGGADITNTAAGTFGMTTTGATQAVTGTGFRPDFVFFLPTPGTTNGTFTTADGFIHLGFAADASKEGLLALGDEDGEGTADTCSFLDDDGSSIVSLVLAENTCADIDAQADLASFDANGFTINKPNLPAATTNVFYLAIKGGQWHAGSFDKPLSAQSQAISSVGFQPVGLFLASAGKVDATLATQDGVQDDFHWDIGAANSASSEGSVLVISDLADTALNPGARTVSTAVAETGTDADGSSFTLTGVADLTSFDPNGFTLNWSTADGTARRVIYWALGNNLTVTVGTSGTQTSSMNIPSTNQYVGGLFSFVGTGSANVTGITITESGTVDALNNLNNIKLYYDLDTSSPYDCASESYGGGETQYGTTDTNGFSAANGTSAFSGSVAVSTTQTMCVYVILDVGSGAAGNETIEISINNVGEVTLSAGTVAGVFPVAISGTTTLLAATVSVSITDGIVNYGTLQLGNASSTLAAEANDTQTVTNDGNVTENFNIKGQNALCPWTLAATAGNEQYIHQFSTTTGAVWLPLTTSYQLFATGVLASSSLPLDLKVTVPTGTTCGTPQMIDVTVQAVAQ